MNLAAEYRNFSYSYQFNAVRFGPGPFHADDTTPFRHKIGMGSRLSTVPPAATKSIAFAYHPGNCCLSDRELSNILFRTIIFACKLDFILIVMTIRF
jgi:hypothetical protein